MTLSRTLALSLVGAVAGADWRDALRAAARRSDRAIECGVSLALDQLSA